MNEKKRPPKATRAAVRLSAMYQVSKQIFDNDRGGPVEDRLGIYMCLVSLHHSAIEEAINILTRREENDVSSDESVAAIVH